MNVQILGIVGSLRRDSYNRSLLQHAGRCLPAGSELVEWAALAAVPPFCEDDERSPAPAVLALRAAIGTADAVLIATPEYNGSIPGQLKNALDWASRPFPDSVLRDKPVAVIGASPSPGGAARAQREARAVLTRIGSRVIDAGVEVAHAYQRFDADGRLTDPVLHSELTDLLGVLCDTTVMPRGQVA
jgi:chromate reductase, NAD(P)H dehydrogenase (quinone)